ncbi:hypothetical protein R1flu_019470 [Riccia fluitans]|uniref:Uncharacterized protein n=1 Tax=Riccia fluitans TaxID=41844 RepID=A0ABD1ZJ35_9MARC
MEDPHMEPCTTNHPASKAGKGTADVDSKPGPRTLIITSRNGRNPRRASATVAKQQAKEPGTYEDRQRKANAYRQITRIIAIGAETTRLSISENRCGRVDLSHAR